MQMGEVHYANPSCAALHISTQCGVKQLQVTCPFGIRRIIPAVARQ
jgi:hypothetical protein